MEVRSVEHNSVLACEISDSTGDLTALFYGRSHIPGLICGSRVRFRGTVGIKDGDPVMINPAYELVVPYTGRQAAEDGKCRPATGQDRHVRPIRPGRAVRRRDWS